jgi:hypothetical protein
MCYFKLRFEKVLALSNFLKFFYNGTRFICALFNKKTKKKSNKSLMTETITKETKKESQKTQSL